MTYTLKILNVCNIYYNTAYSETLSQQAYFNATLNGYCIRLRRALDHYVNKRSFKTTPLAHSVTYQRGESRITNSAMFKAELQIPLCGGLIPKKILAFARDQFD